MVEFKVINAAADQVEGDQFLHCLLNMAAQEQITAGKVQITAAELLDAIPVVYPVTNAVDPKGLPGVSRWNYLLWKSQGSPHLNQAGWCTLCLIIAKKDPVNLGALFSTAEILKANL